MKKLYTLLFLIISIKCFAQDSLQTLNFNRNHIKNTGMQVLGGWAVANIAVGGIGWARTAGQTRYFHQMNAIWNVANLGVAILGYASTQRDRNRTYTARESLDEQKKLEKIFLVNGALDLVYIGSGLYVSHRGIVNNSDQSRGYGNAIIMQGAFLLLFDTVMYSSEKNAGNKLRAFLMKNPITFDGQKIGMLVNF
ncbi:hypothetical protein [Mucilaginibacter sp. UR6-11]|uniref:DUF6992 family protein n=1 Tax=Mucilaginibacter sp. UR6-11 TaxID=1435644 RepID=UPI001E36AD20|nr:hypothetical protein [Mucilaginibacter sp. UR6-11]MCC8425888.1 hypothetical protein [Mucilaginibacter sp. UR6-11]